MTSLPARALRAGRLALAAGAAMFLATTVAQAQVAPPPGPTVEAIKKRGALNCGIDTGVPGFAFQLATMGLLYAVREGLVAMPTLPALHML